MAGMIQIITYLLAFYLVIKGVEILQIALASSRENRVAVILIGSFTLIVCILAAGLFIRMQDEQARSMNRTASGLPILLPSDLHKLVRVFTQPNRRGGIEPLGENAEFARLRGGRAQTARTQSLL